jgi:hypothetical protein
MLRTLLEPRPQGGCALAPAPAASTAGSATATATPPEVSKRAVVVAVLRRGGPKLLEATVIPGFLFYLALVLGGLAVAYLTALAWIFGCLARRLVTGRAVPPILILGAVGISVRTAVAVATGSRFIYFAQPILGTVATGGVFLVSLVIGQPLIGRLANDFWPITPEMATNPRVLSLFRGLTVLWAGVNMATAALTFTLLLSLPLATFVAVKQVSGLAITVCAVAVTIVWSHRTACREGIVSAPRARVAVV